MTQAETLEPEAASAEGLRSEIRSWLEENFPRELSDPAVRETDTELARKWRLAMGHKGWCFPQWPVEYGGAGFSKGEIKILNEELARIDAYNPVGTREQVFGETMTQYGTEEQKRFHLTKMAQGEIRWCQGFSEPGAGSDLAGLSTKAEDAGDHYILNGQKIWTSGGMESEWCFCLVRTDTSQKHGGISFILVDMASPGFEVRRIKLIDGTSPFCETFLTDVKVPKSNILGEVNGGWEVARYQLQVERKFVAMSKGSHGDLPGPGLRELALEYVGVDENGKLIDGDLRSRIAAALMEEQAFKLTYRRTAEPGISPQVRGAVASILKNAGSTVKQVRAELALEIMGQQAMGWSGEAFSEDELGVARAFLSGKAMSIAAGSYEVQNNIISKRVLGLPDTVYKA